jgi:hypothetical protein
MNGVWLRLPTHETRIKRGECILRVNETGYETGSRLGRDGLAALPTLPGTRSGKDGVRGVFWNGTKERGRLIVRNQAADD